MSVQITDENNLPFLCKPFYVLFSEVNSRMLSFVGLIPATIEVIAFEPATVASHNYSIHIYHRENLEDTMSPEKFSSRFVGSKEINKALHYK
jgi:hypothetical protein